jgi:hypothetical protein
LANIKEIGQILREIDYVKSASDLGISDEVKAKVPWLNEPGLIPGVFGTNTLNPLRNPNAFFLWNQFKNNPEVNAVLGAIVKDIITDGYRIEGDIRKKKSAEKFLEDNHADEVFTTLLFDLLVTGNAYIYKQQRSESEIKTLCQGIVSELGFMNVETKANELFYSLKQSDEDVLSTRAFLSIPSSTMKIDADVHGDVRNYVQTASGRIQTFSSEEVIHMTLYKLDGKLYGYTPLESLSTIIATLEDMRDYNRNLWNKGGVPNFLFIFKGLDPKNPSVEAFKQNLREYSNVENKYKSLVGTAGQEGMDIKELNKLDKDMEFKQLSKYLTQCIISTFRVPTSRLSDVLVEKGVKGESGTEAYFREIGNYQTTFEYFINRYLLSDFGVKLKFKRGYLQDEVRETTNFKMKCDVVQQLRSQGIVNDEWTWDYLDIDDEFRGKPIDPTKVGKSPEVNKNEAALGEAMSGSADEMTQNQKRRATQKKNEI